MRAWDKNIETKSLSARVRRMYKKELIITSDNHEIRDEISKKHVRFEHTEDQRRTS